MNRVFVPSLDLVPRVAAGETAAIARLMARAESGSEEVRAALGEVYRGAGRAHLIGVTGPPGSGKSTLVGRLIGRLRALDRRVAVVAVDPSSPYSGGAILGDRLRMNAHSEDPGVFIRSLATGGAGGGLSRAALDLGDILDVAGFDAVIFETVGVGQDEVDVARASHTTIVVSAPGLGDGIQAIKAGILEVADVHVVSKADRPDAAATLADLAIMLDRQPARPDGWRVPALGVSSVAGDGLDTLVETLDRHRTAFAGPAGEARRAGIAAFRIARTADTLLRERFATLPPDDAERRVAARGLDPYAAAARRVRAFMGEDDV